MDDTTPSDSTPPAQPPEGQPPNRIRYGITRAVVGGGHDFLEISKEEFTELQATHAKILAALSIAELLDGTVENFLELEGDMLTSGLRRSVTLDWTWNAFVEDMQRVNRRLGNLLSSARQLLDSTPQKLEKIFGLDSRATRELKAAQSKAYDEVFAYRLMEALRNHTQHQGMPVREISFPQMREEGEEGEVRWRCTVRAKILARELRGDEKFKRTVADELERRAEEELDLLPMVRLYIAGIGTAFQKLREVMDADLQRWDLTLRTAAKMGRDAFAAGTSGLAAVEQDLASRVYTQKCWLFEAPLDRLKQLANKHRALHLVASKYVASSQ